MNARILRTRPANLRLQIEFIKKMIKTLEHPGEFSPEFQNAVTELESLEQPLQQILQHFEALKLPKYNVEYVEVIRSKSLWRKRLRDLLRRLTGYEALLDSLTNRPSLLIKAWRRTQWAILHRQEVKDLRFRIAANQTNLSIPRIGKECATGFNSGRNLNRFDVKNCRFMDWSEIKP